MSIDPVRVQQLHEQGLSPAIIAERLGCKRPAVERHLRQLRAKSEGVTTVPRLDSLPDRLSDLYQLWHKGLSPVERASVPARLHVALSKLEVFAPEGALGEELKKLMLP